MQVANTTRREFVKVAGLAAAGIAAAGVATQSAQAEYAKDVDTWDEETDVLIAGYGTGGLAAAVSAADEGADVLIIEKQGEDFLGGQLRRCGGAIAAAGTSVQKALGVEDDPEDFADYLVAVSEGFADEDLIREYAENSASVIDWVIDDLGGQPVDEWEFCGDNDGLVYDGGPGLNVGTTYYEDYGFEPKQRCHWFTPNYDDPYCSDPTKACWVSPGGTALFKVFDDAVKARDNISTMLETGLVRLVLNDGGEVVGAVAEQDGKEIHIKANKAVIIATGTFVGDEDMFRSYVGREWEQGFNGGWGGVDLPHENDGTGVKAALAAGAELRYPSSYGLYGNAEYSFVSSALHVDANGRCINALGEAVPRLYAAGLATGGFIHNVYATCGISVGRFLYFGRKAGKDAASLESVSE